MTFPINFTGHPAISVPAGLTPEVCQSAFRLLVADTLTKACLRWRAALNKQELGSKAIRTSLRLRHRAERTPELVPGSGICC
jgi:hypothetical protein